MPFARRLSLRLRLSALVALGATVVLTVSSLVLYRDLSGEISEAITAELEIRLAGLPADIDQPPVPGAQHAVVAQAVDASGRVLAPAGAPLLLTGEELAAARRGRMLVDRAVPALGQRARILARPLDTAAGPVVGVAVTSIAPLEQARTRLLLILLVAGPALTSAITGTAWLLAGAALRPVRRMADRAATISMTAPGERLPVPPGRDEIAHLGATLNRMLERIELNVAHERAFIDDASHELRSPLAVLRGELELALLASEEPDAVRRGLQSALEETDLLAALSDRLLTLARADAGQLCPRPDTVELLEAARAAAARAPARTGVAVTVEGAPVSCTCDPGMFGQVLDNLLSNAIRHAGAKVLVQVAPLPGGARIVVADDGPGIPPELLPVAFDRFTRADTSRSRGGTGLGLAITASLVGALGGQVSAANGPPLGGAVLEVELVDDGS